MHIINIFAFIYLYLGATPASAYPEFVGYKYAACMTCHYNGHGNGPLNDYGRALWSAEIAGRPWGQVSEEKLAESSGFLGSVQLPWWFRPGIKARKLYMETNPGSEHSRTREILMQADANIAILFDENQKYVFVGSFGYVEPEIRESGKTSEGWISREHYLRMQATEALWLYFGKTDKVYGIRINDHTAFSRFHTGNDKNDQSHGVIAHYVQPTWEVSGNIFFGDYNVKEEFRQSGFSAMFEYDIREAWRVGASILKSKVELFEQQVMGIHSRTGFGFGSSLLFEAGIIDKKPDIGEAQKGYYLFSEAMQKVFRGYHWFVVGQAYKPDMKHTQQETFSFGTGLLMFPLSRFEVRIEGENTRTFSSTAATKDFWTFMTQLHVSL